MRKHEDLQLELLGLNDAAESVKETVPQQDMNSANTKIEPAKAYPLPAREDVRPVKAYSLAKLTLPGSEDITAGKEYAAPASPPLPRRVRRRLKALLKKDRAFDLDAFLLEARLPAEGEAFVREAFALPSRHIRAGRSHNILFADARNGKVTACESRDLEFAFALLTTHRSDVLAIADQAPKRKATLPQGGWTDCVCDLVVVTTDGVEVWQILDSARADENCQDRPQVFQGEDGRYRSPVWESHFRKLGIKFQIATEKNIHPRFCQTARFLLPYQLGHPQDPITDDEVERCVAFVRTHNGCSVEDLPIENRTRRVELALYFLAQGKLFGCLSEADFRNNPMGVKLFSSAREEEAYRRYFTHARRRPANLNELRTALRQGSLVELHGRSHQVAWLDSSDVVLRDPEGRKTPLSHQELLELNPSIGGLASAEMQFQEIFQNARPELRAAYAKRFSSIEEYLPGGRLHGHRPKDRSVRRWLSAFEEAEHGGLSGHLAIFPGYHLCGRRPTKWPAAVESFYQDILNSEYLSATACSVAHLHRLLEGKFGDAAPDARAVYRRVDGLDPHWVAWKRTGKRGAIDTKSFFGDSRVFGSPHGDRSFQRAHIDSTPADLCHPDDPRQSVASMVDAYDGRVLAWYVCDDSPSELTIRELILECVRRHGALPAEITYDLGPEHNTVWLEKSMAALGVNLDRRPVADPPNGGPVESSFAALCRELIHNLAGNTKLMKRARIVTRVMKPELYAVWSAEDFRELVDEYFELRNDLPRAGKPSPNDIAAACYQTFGLPPRQMPTVDDLAVLLLPFVDGHTRMISKRGFVRYNGRNFGIRGENNLLRSYGGKELPIRYLPGHKDTIFVCLDHPRKTIPVQAIGCTGPAQPILDLASEKAAKRAAAAREKAVSPSEAKGKFAVRILNKQRELLGRPDAISRRRRRKTRPTNVVRFPKVQTAASRAKPAAVVDIIHPE